MKKSKKTLSMILGLLLIWAFVVPAIPAGIIAAPATEPAPAQAAASEGGLSAEIGYGDGKSYISAGFENGADREIKGNFILVFYNLRGQFVFAETKGFEVGALGAVSAVFDTDPDDYPFTMHTRKVFCWDEDYAPLTDPVTVDEHNAALRRAAYQSSAVDEFHTVTAI